ncbi:MAG TPA: GNAT family N-acetyltransferase [Patescibacteria group bacterium]|nr:GNAT family N-acetyltransferase [Patescibacteria group bacterium]
MSALQTEKDPILIDVPMPIETPRLILRPVAPGDGAAGFECVSETWDQLSTWMPWAEKRPTIQEQEARARRVHAQFILREDIPVVGIEKASGRAVVWTGLHRFCWKLRRFEIGYYVRASAQGAGFATESTNALIRYAFGALDARRVEICHADGNDRSRRVIEKLGFEREAVKRQAGLLPGGRFADHYTYVRLGIEGLPPLDVRWGPP